MQMATFEDWKEGDLAIRKNSLCRIVRIHFDEYPPHVTVKMLEDGNEIGTEFSKLRHPLPSELEALEQTNLSDNNNNNNNNVVAGNTSSDIDTNDRRQTNEEISKDPNKTSIKTDTTNNNAENNDNNTNNREDNDNDSNNYSDNENDTNIKDSKTAGNSNITKPVSKPSPSTSAPPPRQRPYEEHKKKTVPISKTTTPTSTPMTTKKDQQNKKSNNRNNNPTAANRRSRMFGDEWDSPLMRKRFFDDFDFFF